MKELRLVAPLHHNSGYAKAGRALLAAAVAAGYAVEAVETEMDTVVSVRMDGRVERSHRPKFGNRNRPPEQEAELRAALEHRVQPGAPTLIMNPPCGLSDWPEYCDGPRIGLTMLEADTLNPLWAQAARNVDLLLAPSPWNVETLTRQVPGVCTQLFPLCVDERFWSVTGPAIEVGQRPDFVFCSVFSTCERKGWRALIQAFSEEFPGESVGLMLKPTRVEEVQELAGWARERGAWIHVVEDECTDAEMSAFYRGGDCYVLPSAEGFGVTFVEAMMCGLPVIGLDKGGTEQIVSEDNGYPIPSSMVSCAGQLPQLYRSDYRWPAASVADIRAAMRRAVDGSDKWDASDLAEAADWKWGRHAIGKRLNKMVDYARSRFEYSPICQLPLNTAPAGVAVITTHNHLEATKLCVASLREHSPELRIILADDHSEDDTLAWAWDNDLCVVAGTEPGNVAATREAVLEALRAEYPDDDTAPYVAFLDNDVEVTAGWWEGLTRVLAENPQIGILAARKVLKSTGETQNVGNKLRLDGNSYPLLLGRPLVWCDYVETACAVVRPEVWKSVRLDPAFPIFYEDTDFCFEARAQGWEVAATASVTVIHDAHTTSCTREGEGNLRRRQFMRKWKDVI